VRLPVAWLIIVVAGAALLPLESGFYNPPLGAVASGLKQETTTLEEREVLELTVSPDDVARLGRPTIETFSEWYGTQDTVECSIRRTFASDRPVYATRSLPLDTKVFLCLD
jgi:hypothetical protein